MSDARAEPLMSKDDADRMRRVERLAQEGSQGLRALIAQLGDPSWAVRRAVSGALSRLGQPAIEPLSALLLHERDSEARLAAAVDTLVSSRGDVDAAMMALLDADSPPPVLCDAAQVLGRRRSVAAVPRLEALAVHADDNVAVAGLEALARIGGGAGVGTLLGVVKEGNFFRIFPAIEVLGGSGDPRAVDPLIALLAQPLFAVEAARALGHTGDGRAAPALIHLLTSEDLGLVRAAAASLVEIQRHLYERLGSTEVFERRLSSMRDAELACARLAASVGDADPAERSAVARLLGWIACKAGVPILFRFLAEGGAVGGAAASALKSFGPEISELVFAELAHADSAMRLSLLPLLTGRRDAAAKVVVCLQDPDASVRVAACDALGQLGDVAVVEPLFALLDDEDARVSQAACAAIQSLGSRRTEELALAAAANGSPRVRRAALRMIAYFGYDSGLDALLAAMSDPDERLREAAIQGLAFVEDPRALEALLRTAGHENPKTRAAVVRALGRTWARPQVLQAVRQRLKDDDAWVRYYACQSLAKLRDPAAVDWVLGLLDDPAGQVRIAVVDALAVLRSDRASAALATAARSSDPDVRRSALVGLGVARRKEALPLLLEAASSEDGATRLVALAALHEFDSPEVVAALTRGALDADESVRNAAIGFLASRPGPEATTALVEIAQQPIARARAVDALAQPAQGRLGGILAVLEDSNETLAAMLVGALARADRPDWSAALLIAMRMENVYVRRAAAAALSVRHGESGRAELERASSEDPDAEVRRICTLALGG